MRVPAFVWFTIGLLAAAGACSSAPCETSAWYPDEDGDGFGGRFGAVAACEAPSGFVIDSSDCDDADPSLTPNSQWYLDADGDGLGTDALVRIQCVQPTGFVPNTDDCDDDDPTKRMGSNWYIDADADGYGDLSEPVDSCTAPPEAVSNGDDCDDGNPAIHPQASEVCDGIDNDCDGKTDDADDSIEVASQSPRFEDLDGDGWGTNTFVGRSCTNGPLQAGRSGDCDDDDPTRHPGRLDWKNGEDSDCDGSIDLMDMNFSELGIHSHERYKSFARSLVVADVDGDGLNEMLIGSTSQDNPSLSGIDHGGIHYVDAANYDQLQDSSNGKLWYGTEPDSYLGTYAGLHSDIDGDGIADAFVTLPSFDSTRGKVFHISVDSESGKSVEEVAANVWVGPQQNSYFGQAYLAVGDRMAIAARDGSTEGAEKNGIVYLMDKDSINDGSALADLPFMSGTNSRDRFGFHVFDAADTNGDGSKEVGIVAPYGEPSSDLGNCGELHLFDASDLGVSATGPADALRTIRGHYAFEYFGLTTATSAGDVNGDGYDDLAASYEYADPVERDEGVARVILGGATPPAEDSSANAYWTIEGSLLRSRLGASLSGPGDMDGDGAGELFIGLTGIPRGTAANAGAFVGLSSQNGSGTWVHGVDAFDVAAIGESANDYLGRAIRPAGDINGDGLQDLWVTSTGGYRGYGAAYLIYGSKL